MLPKYLICVVLGVAASEEMKMYMRKARMEDQASSSSGYMYHSDLDEPSSYVSFESSSGDMSHFGYPPIAISHYTHDIPNGYQSYERYYPEYSGNYVHSISDYHEGNSGLDFEPYKYGYGYGKELASDYAKGDGEKFDKEKYSSEGEKGESGYKSEEGHAIAEKGKHSNAEEKGHYSKGGGNKEGYHDSAEHYGSKDEAAKSAKGESHSESKGHKKGSKTTGYHKVFHKDEYKKDHSFYDEADKQGHFKKYGSTDSHHSSEDGGSAKGSHHNSGFHVDEAGKKGEFNKGHYDAADSKHREKLGEGAYHQHHAEFAKDGGKSEGKSFGYKTGSDK